MLNTELLFKLIDDKYEGSKIGIKINKFCKDCKIKTYRFKRAIEGKCYLLNDEMYRIVEILRLKNKEIKMVFFYQKAIKINEK